MSTTTTNTIDQRINDLLQEVGDRIGTERVADIFGGILVGAARTKGSIEKSLDTLLTYTNLPTRAEHEALSESVDAMAKRVEVLARRIERLQVDVKKHSKVLAKPAPKRAAAKSKTTTSRSAASKSKAGKAKAKPTRGRAASRAKTTRGRR